MFTRKCVNLLGLQWPVYTRIYSDTISPNQFDFCRGANTIQTCTAVREISVSRHDGGLIEGSLKPLRASQHCRIERFQGAFNWSPIMPRDAGLSDSQRDSSWIIEFILQLNSFIYLCWSKNKISVNRNEIWRSREYF